MTREAANDGGIPDLSLSAAPFAHAARARLACFHHAYAVAVRLRESSGDRQYVIRTASPLQPVRVSPWPPGPHELLMALVA